MKRSVLILTAIFALALPAASGASPGAGPWAGYVDVARRDGPQRYQFTFIRTAFTVPTLSCFAQETGADSVALWAGMDGFAALRETSDLEQTGVWGTCSGLAPKPGEWMSPGWHAFTETVPKAPTYLKDRVRPGDQIVASVTFYQQQGRFGFALFDMTRGWRETSYASCPVHTCPRDGVEVVTEDPSLGARRLLLSVFGTVHYSSTMVALANGQSGTLSTKQPYWTGNALQITASNTNFTTLATTSALSAGGSAFSTSFQPTS